MADDQQPEKKKFSRRRFLTRSAIVLGGTVVTAYLARSPIRRWVAQTAEGLDLPALINTYKPLFWFQVMDDNTILMRSPKVEMGQGIFTGFAMLAAEELEITLEQIKVVHANTAEGPVDKTATGGSSSTSSLYVHIRETAATMREMLKLAAAKHWKVEVATVKAQNAILSSGKQSISYAAITQLAKDWEIPSAPPLKPRSEFKYVGKEVKRVDLQPKVMGEALYGIDHALPGMLYALILQSPYINGTLKTVDTTEAEKSAGVVKLINEEGLIAVVASNRFATETALYKIKASWDVPKKWQQEEIVQLITVGNGTGVSVQDHGDAASVMEKYPQEIYQQEYRTPMAAHAHMEPNGTVAWVQKEKTKIITGTQAPGLIRGQVADALAISKDLVEVEVAFLGGGFGRRNNLSNAAQAAIISKKMGKPVHVFNTREQEFMDASYRPNTHHVLKAVIDKNGNVTAITHDQTTPDMMVKEMVGSAALTMLGADFISAGHGASIIYNIENRAAKVWQCTTPVRIGIWRSVGIFPNSFAIESFINELAYKTGKDPLAFRMSLLKGPEQIHQRYLKVLQTLQEKSGWVQPKKPGIGRGIAIANDRKTIAAAVIEVNINQGKIQVNKVTHVTDVGFCINPDGVRMQIEGCIMMGISSALYEGLYVKDGQIDCSNFHAYPLATLKDTPEINITILSNADEPYGAGEPPLGPIAPAIAAAVFDATGQRLRSLPLKLQG